MTNWKVGDRPWISKAVYEEVIHDCPVCFGKKEVVLILGNDDRVTLPCDYCGKGWEGPRGYVIETEFSIGVEQLTIDSIEATFTFDGEKRRYILFGSRCASDEDLCVTKEQAEEKSREWIAKDIIEKSTRAEYIKHNVHKTFSWNAGYHLREAKRDESSAAHHRERAILCKAKVKDEGSSK